MILRNLAPVAAWFLLLAPAAGAAVPVDGHAGREKTAPNAEGAEEHGSPAEADGAAEDEAESRAAAPAGVDEPALPRPESSAASATGRRSGTGTTFVIGAIMLAAAVVATAYALSRKPRIRVIRREPRE